MNVENFHAAIVSPALQAVAAHWAAARGGRIMPSWEQIQPTRIAAQLSIVWVYKYDRETRRFTGRLAGDRIARTLGKNFRGISLDDVHPPEILPHMQLRMLRGVEVPAAYHSSGKLFRQGDRIAFGERVAMPLASDGFHADGIIGASDYDYPVTNPGYAPVEMLADEERWFPLAPQMAEA